MKVGGRLRLPTAANIALAAAIMCIVPGGVPLAEGFALSSAICRIRGAGLKISPRRAMALCRLRMGGGSSETNFVGNSKASSLQTTSGGRSPSATGKRDKIGLDPKQLKGYVIVPETSTSPVQKNNGWTLWDQVRPFPITTRVFFRAPPTPSPHSPRLLDSCRAFAARLRRNTVWLSDWFPSGRRGRGASL